MSTQKNTSPPFEDFDTQSLYKQSPPHGDTAWYSDGGFLLNLRTSAPRTFPRLRMRFNPRPPCGERQQNSTNMQLFFNNYSGVLPDCCKNSNISCAILRCFSCSLYIRVMKYPRFDFLCIYYTRFRWFCHEEPNDCGYNISATPVLVYRRKIIP